MTKIVISGGAKSYMLYDVCRVLLFTGDKKITNPLVQKVCDQEIKNHAGAPTECVAHHKAAEIPDKICV